MGRDNVLTFPSVQQPLSSLQTPIPFLTLLLTLPFPPPYPYLPPFPSSLPFIPSYLCLSPFPSLPLPLSLSLLIFASLLFPPSYLCLSPFLSSFPLPLSLHPPVSSFPFPPFSSLSSSPFLSPPSSVLSSSFSIHSSIPPSLSYTFTLSFTSAHATYIFSFTHVPSLTWVSEYDTLLVYNNNYISVYAQQYFLKI